MQYKSTRARTEYFDFHEVVLTGIAPDGGLFVPEKDIRFDSLDLADMVSMSYDNLAYKIIKQFVKDIPQQKIKEIIEQAYFTGNFPQEIVPISQLSKNLSILELWHGPTAAFKDMALQILPGFMEASLELANEENEILILTATSGDTGKAALEGFKNKKGIKIMVFYPDKGVSQMQERQMVSQEGDNLKVLAIRGNFDDGQSAIKEIFNDIEFKEKLLAKGIKLSSANSINWGRLLPQIIYYFYAYGSLVNNEIIEHGSRINVVVPTGNFGNILACYYARQAGLPINKIICASNDNNILTDFLLTGVYNKNRQFLTTISPAMDILVSSNLERLLYDASGDDDVLISKYMESLKEKGVYNVDKKIINTINNVMWASYATQEETKDTIKNIYEAYNYLIDPHTAVGLNVYDKYVISTGDMTNAICLSTASPFKFGKSVASSLYGEDLIKDMDDFEVNSFLSQKTGKEIPSSLKDIENKEIIHNEVIEIEEIRQAILDFIG